MTKQLRLDGRTLDDAIDEAEQIITAAIEQHLPTKVFALYSGGNDSTVLVHLAQQYVDAVAHVDTGIGIAETRMFASTFTAYLGLPWVKLQAPISYEKLVLDVLGGFPGPKAHTITYNRLKERGLRQLQRDALGDKPGRHDRVLFLTGIRAAESSRRMGRGRLSDREGRRVWLNPIYYFTNEDMAEYRERFDLPRNEVSDNLHLSGECLCGAYAKPGEIEQIDFFYPEVGQRIHALEDECRSRGYRRCVWGWGSKYPELAAPPPGPLCSNCTLWKDEGVA